MEWFCIRLEDKIINKGILAFTFVLLFPNQCPSPKAPSTNGVFHVIAPTAYSDLPFLPTIGIAWNERCWAWWVADALKYYIYPRLFKIYLTVQFQCQVKVGIPICRLWSFVYMGEKVGPENRKSRILVLIYILMWISEWNKDAQYLTLARTWAARK